MLHGGLPALGCDFPENPCQLMPAPLNRRPDFSVIRIKDRYLDCDASPFGGWEFHSCCRRESPGIRLEDFGMYGFRSTQSALRIGKVSYGALE